MIRSDAGRLPGEDYSENKQCELVFGLNSKICPDMENDGKSHTKSKNISLIII